MSRVPRVHNNQHRKSTHDNRQKQADSYQDHPVMTSDTKKVTFPQAVPGLHYDYSLPEMPPADMSRVRPSQNNRYRKSNGSSGLRPRDQKQANARQVHPEMTNANKFVAFQKADPGLPNKYDEVKAFSTFVPYGGLTKRGRTAHLPYAVEHTVRLTIDNMPFERSEEIATDITVLLSWMSATVVPSWARERGLPGSRQYYLKMAGMSDYDRSTMIDGRGLVAPAKKRHIFAKTNIPIELIRDLLKDPRLYVLADRNGFHACWDGHRPNPYVRYDAVEDGTTVSRQDAHDVNQHNRCPPPPPPPPPPPRAAVHYVEDGTKVSRLDAHDVKHDRCSPSAPSVHCDAVEDGTIDSSQDAHDVQRMVAFGNEIRAMGLRARHRFTDGLPCTSVRVDYLADRKVEGTYAAPYPTSNNRRLTGKRPDE